jgi:hypothetical protein
VAGGVGVGAGAGVGVGAGAGVGVVAWLRRSRFGVKSGPKPSAFPERGCLKWVGTYLSRAGRALWWCGSILSWLGPRPKSQEQESANFLGPLGKSDV